jgi:ABC-type sugar transport system ATPase subunit
MEQAAGPADETPPLIEVRNVTKRFGGVVALDRVNFDVQQGEVMGLVGDNGAGKSTLIKILSGVHQPDEGSVYFRGRPVHLSSPQDAWALGIATIYQELALAEKMTVHENVFLGRELVSPVLGLPILDRSTMRERAAALLHGLGVQIPSLESRVQTLSGGQRQAIAIARVLDQDASVIIMDEPMAALAVAEVTKILDLIRQLRATGRTVILISHNLRDVLDVADRITVLRRGRRVAVRRAALTTLDEIVKLITGGSNGEPDVTYPREPFYTDNSN